MTKSTWIPVNWNLLINPTAKSHTSLHITQIPQIKSHEYKLFHSLSFFCYITTCIIFTQPFYYFNYNSHFFKTQLLIRCIQLFNLSLASILQFLFKILQHGWQGQLPPSHNSTNNNINPSECAAISPYETKCKKKTKTHPLIHAYSECRPLCTLYRSESLTRGPKWPLLSIPYFLSHICQSFHFTVFFAYKNKK
jgi:hypothetical protein